MTSQSLLIWVPLAINILVIFGVFVGKNWIVSRIARGVQHTFDAKLERIRTDLREVEERLKSDLRRKESEIVALRDGVLSGRMQRQALLDKRRLEAVERVWAAVMALGPYRKNAHWMSSMNLKALVEEGPHDATIQKLMAIFSELPPEFKMENVAIAERPFVSPLAWAYFTALQTVLLTIYALVKAIELGVKNADKLIKVDSLREMLKKALPHQASLIEKWEIPSFYHFVDELEGCIFTELTKMLDGEEVDKASIIRSAEILKLSKTATDQFEREIDSSGLSGNIKPDPSRSPSPHG